MAIKETLSCFDFDLHPQIVTHAKIPSMHGFDLDIDHEIAPWDLIVYEPMPETLSIVQTQATVAV
ncbi:hypothetical protein [Neisseria musculi]|uniref:hypothetical protein n=1 Tax=Neisseria musculi TaxID=1815583 RepID=UPI003EBA6D90